MMYYSDKLETLKDIFGSSDITLERSSIVVNNRVYPVINDVIVLIDPAQYPDSLRKMVEGCEKNSLGFTDFAEDIQFTFGEEWRKFPDIMLEHCNEFSAYFDLVDISTLKKSRVCDLGCGIGRWSYFLKDTCRELILVDFSEAIFVARRNLQNCDSAIFFMGDLKRLPFREGFAEFLFCIGVLHHLPTNALVEVRRLKKYAPILLIYVYYALDNRPPSYRFLLSLVTAIRIIVSKIRNPAFRMIFVNIIAVFIYKPLVGLGKILSIFGFGNLIPLYEGYDGKGLKRVRQDVYDRFFTGIEQRFSQNEIMGLRDTFENIKVSANIPYWHFLCA